MQKINIQKIKDYHSMHKNIRVDNSMSKLDTGNRCNAGCWFCYYKDSLGSPDKSFQKIKKEIEALAASGVTTFELSGGESTIHPDLFKIILEVKKYGEFAIITNAIDTDQSFWDRIIKLEPKFIKFSIQGHQKEHDRILKRKGAFKNIIRSINHLKDKVPIRINTVCTQSDKDSTNFITRLYNFIDGCSYIEELNFIPLNQFADQKDYVLTKTTLAEMFLWAENINMNSKTLIKYIPFCTFSNQPQNQKNIMNYFDMIETDEDWNPWYSKDTDKIYPDITTDIIIDDIVKKREQLYFKNQDCLGCSFSYRCDGFKGAS